MDYTSRCVTVLVYGFSHRIGWAGSRIGLVLVSDGMGPLWPTRLSQIGWDPFRLGRNHFPLRFEAERRTTTKVLDIVLN